MQNSTHTHTPTEHAMNRSEKSELKTEKKNFKLNYSLIFLGL